MTPTQQTSLLVKRREHLKIREREACYSISSRHFKGVFSFNSVIAVV